MNFFYETRLVLIIYFFSALSFMEQATVEGNKLKCYKKDECSCIVNSTKPQLQISLWPIESKNNIMDESENCKYAVNLCHGVHMTSKTNSGCQNSTVCQYNTEGNEVFEIGRYGSAEFGFYDNVTKSMYVHYSGVEQENVNRSILIQLQCTNKGKASDATYIAFGSNVLSLNKFVGTIKTKAACLSRVVTPTRKPTSTQTSTTSSTSSTIPTSRSTTSIPTSANTSSSSPTHKLPETRKNHGGLSTVYIVLIAIGSFAVLCACCFVVYILIMKRRKRSILESEQEAQQEYYH